MLYLISISLRIAPFNRATKTLALLVLLGSFVVVSAFFFNFYFSTEKGLSERPWARGFLSFSGSELATGTRSRSGVLELWWKASKQVKGTKTCFERGFVTLRNDRVAFFAASSASRWCWRVVLLVVYKPPKRTEQKSRGTGSTAMVCEESHFPEQSQHTFHEYTLCKSVWVLFRLF